MAITRDVDNVGSNAEMPIPARQATARSSSLKQSNTSRICGQTAANKLTTPSDCVSSRRKEPLFAPARPSSPIHELGRHLDAPLARSPVANELRQGLILRAGSEAAGDGCARPSAILG